MDLRTGAAFWPVRDGLLHTYPPLDSDLDADVVVIGAGCTGALAAYRLCEAGANVVVLDRRDVASGSTAATTGLLLYETDTSLAELAASIGENDAVRAWQLGREAIDEIGDLCRTLDDGCGFARRSSLYLASSRRDARALAREHSLRVRHGFDAEWVSAAEINARYGIDAPAAIAGRGAGEIDNYRFTHTLLRAASERGARVFDRTEVRNVRPHRDHVIVVTARGPRIKAGHVVWASGYESVEETQKKVGRQYSTWVVVSEPVGDFGSWHDRALIWETARPYLYARTTDDGRLMLGGEDEASATRHAKDRLLDPKARRLIDRFHRWFPDIVFEPAYRWAGVFSTTRDGLPYIGSVREHPRAWLALGYGGNGITFAAIAARLIRDAWRGVPNPDAAIFAFDRGSRRR